jgi:hypothetical protein
VQFSTIAVSRYWEIAGNSSTAQFVLWLQVSGMEATKGEKLEEVSDDEERVSGPVGYIPAMLEGNAQKEQEG